MFEGFFPFVRRPVWTIDLSQTLWEVLDIKSELEGGEDVLSSSGNSCPTMYCGIRSLINDILRSGGGEARTRRKQNCDFTRWLSLSLNSWSSFHLGCCHLFLGCCLVFWLVAHFSIGHYFAWKSTSINQEKEPLIFWLLEQMVLFSCKIE